MPFSTTLSLFRSSHVAYLISLSKQPFFVGSCRLADLSALTEARQNSEFDRLVKATTLIDVEILSHHCAEEDARTAAHTAIVLHRPYCNLNGAPRVMSPGVTTGAVIDKATGETFTSAAAAARVIGVTRQSMSHHLNTPGSTVAGRTFERITS